MKNSLAFIVALCFIHFVLTAADSSFEIRDGNCSKALLNDLVFQKHVHLVQMPLIKREANVSMILKIYYLKIESNYFQVTYYGDYRIYCLTVLSQKPASINSTVEIIEGGTNHAFVTLKMVSVVNHGFEYIINVYANKTKQIWTFE